MASLAKATPCEIRRSPPVTSWCGDMVLVIVRRILLASIPDINLKSTLRSDNFLRSEMRRLCAFLPGLLPNTINEVL